MWNNGILQAKICMIKLLSLNVHTSFIKKNNNNAYKKMPYTIYYIISVNDNIVVLQ